MISRTIGTPSSRRNCLGFLQILKGKQIKIKINNNISFSSPYHHNLHPHPHQTLISLSSQPLTASSLQQQMSSTLLSFIKPHHLHHLSPSTRSALVGLSRAAALLTSAMAMSSRWASRAAISMLGLVSCRLGEQIKLH